MNLPSLFSTSELQPFVGFPTFNDVLRNWPFTGSSKLSVDVEEESDRYLVKANVPGVKRENIDISLGDGNLTLRIKESKEKETKEANYLMKERSYESTTRSMNLPYTHSSKEVEAELRDGVLHITVPKCDDKKCRKVKIK